MDCNVTMSHYVTKETEPVEIERDLIGLRNLN